MDILVNGTPLLAPLTGIGQYVRHLFSAMDKMPEAKLRMYYGLHCEEGMHMPTVRSVQATQRLYGFAQRLLPRPRSLKKLTEKLLFKYHTRGDFDNTIYHEPNYIAMPFNGPMVLTVCDLSCFEHPEAHPRERIQLLQRDMPASIERADHIIVISESTGAALRRCFNIDSSRVTTTYLAADARFHPVDADLLRPKLAALGLMPGHYLLSVGTLEPRKNLPALFSAYAGLPAALRKRYPLVVAGMRGWNTVDLMASAQALINSGELLLLGYVEDALIPALFAGAATFCYPSRYEGFGLPALEAMACGVPVVTSNQTSLPEVVGPAGMMVDPDDVDAMRESLQRLLEDRAYAAALGQLGLARAKSFSWERCAIETFSVYKQVLDARGQPS